MKTFNAVYLLFAAVALTGNVDAADSEPGKALFDRWCAGCHAGTSRGGRLAAGSYVLQQRYQDKLPADLEKRTDLVPAYIKLTVRNGINIMPRTRKTEISDAEMESLVAYLTRSN